MTRLAILISTFGYIGYVPFAPGTIGSAAGLLVYAVIRLGPPPLEPLAIAMLFAAGVAAGRRAERHFGGVDPGPVVIDEVMGMLITLFLIPVGWSGAVAGFFLFRVFDIVKPYPAGRLEVLPGGLGVMADDAMAAIYANVVMRVIWWLAPSWIV
jgi:phosphatidylglycerophosphatase A